MSTLHPGTHAAPPGALTAARLKVTAVLNAAELLAVPVPEGRPRVMLRISCPIAP